MFVCILKKLLDILSQRIWLFALTIKALKRFYPASLVSLLSVSCKIVISHRHTLIPPVMCPPPLDMIYIYGSALKAHSPIKNASKKYFFKYIKSVTPFEANK